jgi:hypothetical protein
MRLRGVESHIRYFRALEKWLHLLDSAGGATLRERR